MCHVCKNKVAPHKATLHISGGRVEIQLCRAHDLELFKKGQTRFLAAYSQQISALTQKTKEKEVTTDDSSEFNFS